MKDVYLIEALRTPFGAMGGMLAGVEAPNLAAAVIRGVLDSCALKPAAVNQVIIGQVLTAGCGQAPARQALRRAGLPDGVQALTINKVCSSGLKAILLAADAIMLGQAHAAIAGGMENMSRAPYLLTRARSGYRLGHDQLFDSMLLDGLQDPYNGQRMGELGERSAGRHGITREAQDEFARRSYGRARAAITAGLFAPEIVPVTPVEARPSSHPLDRDEEPFRLDPDAMARFKPVFREGGTITAGNASKINDGAALALLCDRTTVRRFGLEPRARLVASASESRHPDQFPEAPAAAIAAVCRKAGLSTDQIGLLEINEAFAGVVLHAITALRLDPERVNVNGGAIAIGHPIGASGGRLVATLIREMGHRGERYGLAAICNGGGEAVAAIFERM